MSRPQKIPNTAIRNKMQAEQSILDRIQRRQIKWYGHLLRMDDIHWPKIIYHLTPYSRKRRGRPSNHGITKWWTLWEAETWKNIWQKIFGIWEQIDNFPSMHSPVIGTNSWFSNLFQLIHPSSSSPSTFSTKYPVIQSLKWHYFIMLQQMSSFLPMSSWHYSYSLQVWE